MGDPVVLLTTAEIDTAAFAGILACLGGTLDPDDADRGRVSRGQCHVWIYRDVERLDDTPKNVADQIAAKLGAPPHGGLVLEPSRQPGTERLVMDIARAFGTLAGSAVGYKYGNSRPCRSSAAHARFSLTRRYVKPRKSRACRIKCLLECDVKVAFSTV
jgi:hypothetical protein